MIEFEVCKQRKKIKKEGALNMNVQQKLDFETKNFDDTLTVRFYNLENLDQEGTRKGLVMTGLYNKNLSNVLFEDAANN